MVCMHTVNCWPCAAPTVSKSCWPWHHPRPATVAGRVNARSAAVADRGQFCLAISNCCWSHTNNCDQQQLLKKIIKKKYRKTWVQERVIHGCVRVRKIRFLSWRRDWNIESVKNYQRKIASTILLVIFRKFFLPFVVLLVVCLN